MRKVLLSVAVVFLLLIGVGGYLGYQAFRTYGEVRESSITHAQFEAQRIGTAEGAVFDALPKPLDGSESDIYDKHDTTKSGKPAGSSCVYYAVDPLSESGDRPLFRFCFTGGKLAEKKQIQVEP